MFISSAVRTTFAKKIWAFDELFQEINIFFDRYTWSLALCSLVWRFENHDLARHVNQILHHRWSFQTRHLTIDAWIISKIQFSSRKKLVLTSRDILTSFDKWHAWQDSTVVSRSVLTKISFRSAKNTASSCCRCRVFVFSVFPLHSSGSVTDSEYPNLGHRKSELECRHIVSWRECYQ